MLYGGLRNSPPSISHLTERATSDHPPLRLQRQGLCLNAGDKPSNSSSGVRNCTFQAPRPHLQQHCRCSILETNMSRVLVSAGTHCHLQVSGLDDEPSCCLQLQLQKSAVQTDCHPQLGRPSTAVSPLLFCMVLDAICKQLLQLRLRAKRGTAGSCHGSAPDSTSSLEA